MKESVRSFGETAWISVDFGDDKIYEGSFINLICKNATYINARLLYILEDGIYVDTHQGEPEMIMTIPFSNIITLERATLQTVKG